jgi:hypothetical protein
MRKQFNLSVALSALLIAGCAGTSSPNNQPPPPVAGVQVSVSPPTANIRAGDSLPFSAAVSGTTNTAVTWSITGTAGSPPVIGTITSAGNYTASAALPNPNTLTVRATSVADISVSGSSSVTLLNPTPVLTGINPSSVGTGNFTLTVTGSKFVNGAQVLLGTTPMQTIFAPLLNSLPPAQPAPPGLTP